MNKAVSRELQAMRAEAHDAQQVAHDKLREAAQKQALLSDMVQELQHDKERAVAGAGSELQQISQAKDALWMELIQGREEWTKVRTELEVVIGDIYAEKGDVEVRLHKSESQAVELMGQLEQLIATHATTQQELTARKTSLVEAMGLAQTLHKENLAWEERARAAEAAARIAEVSLEQLSFEADDLRDQLDSLSMQNSTYLHDREALSADLKERDERLKGLEAELRAVQDRYVALLDSHSSSTAGTEERDEREQRTQEALLDCLQKKEAAEKAFVAAQRAAENADSALERAMAETGRLDREGRQKDEMLADFQAALDKARHASLGLEEQAAELKASNDALLEEVLDTRRAADTMQAKMSAAEAQRDQAVSVAESLRAERTGLEQRAVQLTLAIDAAGSEVAELQQAAYDAQQGYELRLAEKDGVLAELREALKATSGAALEAAPAPPPAPTPASAGLADAPTDCLVADLRRRLEVSETALETSRITVRMAIETAQKEVQAAKVESAAAREKSMKIELQYRKQAAAAKASGEPVAAGALASNASNTLPARSSESLLAPAPLTSPQPTSQTVRRLSDGSMGPSVGIGAGMPAAPPFPMTNPGPLGLSINGMNNGITWGLSGLHTRQTPAPLPPAPAPASVPQPTSHPHAAPPAPPPPHSRPELSTSNPNPNPNPNPLHSRPELSADEVLAEFGFTPSKVPTASQNHPPCISVPPEVLLPRAQPVLSTPILPGPRGENELILPDEGLDDDENYMGVVSSPTHGGGGSPGAYGSSYSMMTSAVGAGRALSSTIGTSISTLSQWSNSAGTLTEGEISARISTRTFILKEWQTTYWVIQAGELLLYRNKMDYKYNPSGTQIKKRIMLCKATVRVQPLKAKEYDQGNGNRVLMHNFMIDQEHDWGLEHLVKFASTNKQQCEGFYRQLKLSLK